MDKPFSRAENKKPKWIITYPTQFLGKDLCFFIQVKVQVVKKTQTKNFSNYGHNFAVGLLAFLSTRSPDRWTIPTSWESRFGHFRGKLLWPCWWGEGGQVGKYIFFLKFLEN